MGSIEEALPDAPARRDALAAELAGAAAASAPAATIVAAPRGWGKRSLLDRISAEMKRRSRPHAFLDAARCTTHPDEFACSYAVALLESSAAPETDAAGRSGESPVARPAGVATPQARLRSLLAARRIQDLPRVWPIVEKLAAELSRRRGSGESVVRLVFSLPQSLWADTGHVPAVLAADLHELARLTPYPGLQQILREFAAHLSEPYSPVVVATVSPHGRPRLLLDRLRASLGARLSVRDLPPLEAIEIEEIAGAASGPDWTVSRLACLTGGRLLTLSVLGARLARGMPLAGALASEIGKPGGRLAQELRFDYNLLIDRARGHAASRSILNILAREEGLDLTGIARRLRRSAGSTLDYLRWLIEVGLVRREGRRYNFADPLLRLYVLLHEVPESPRSADGCAAAIERFLSSLESTPADLSPLGRPRTRTPGGAPRAARRPAAPASPPPALPPRRDEFLIEFD